MKYHSYGCVFTRLLAIISLLLITSTYSLSVSAVDAIYAGGKHRAAIKGYDPVAYFTENRAVIGLKQFSLDYKGAKWLFSSAENRALFEQNPSHYEPQYGGYCAYAVAKNTTASIRPEYFTIHEGKLYLNYSKSVNKKWVKDKRGYIQTAERNWPSLMEK